jgi:hypothetical protein
MTESHCEEPAEGPGALPGKATWQSAVISRIFAIIFVLEERRLLRERLLALT